MIFDDIQDLAFNATNSALSDLSVAARSKLYEAMADEFVKTAKVKDEAMVDSFLAQIKAAVDTLTITCTRDGIAIFTSSDSKVFARYRFGSLWFENRGDALSRALDKALSNSRI